MNEKQYMKFKNTLTNLPTQYLSSMLQSNTKEFENYGKHVNNSSLDSYKKVLNSIKVLSATRGVVIQLHNANR